jgi:DNA-binding IclR family transcriptional regulator
MAAIRPSARWRWSAASSPGFGLAFIVIQCLEVYSSSAGRLTTTAKLDRKRDVGLSPDAPQSRSKNELSSLKRGLFALELLNQHSLLSAGALAKAMSVDRTTARRVLDTLVSEGLAEKILGHSGYRLTPRVGRLSRGLSEELIISHVATPLLIEATKEVGWSLAVATPSDDKMIIQVTTNDISPHRTYRIRVGAALPLLASQCGRLAIAYMPDEERTAVLSTPPESWDAWQDSFEQIREQGCVLPPRTPGQSRHIVCVPIFSDNKVLAVLAMSYFASAVSQKQLEGEYIPLLKRLSEEISQRAKATRFTAN